VVILTESTKGEQGLSQATKVRCEINSMIEPLVF